MLRHRELRGLAAARPLGALTAGERILDGLHRLRCAECRRLARHSRETAMALLEALPEVPATPALRARVLTSVGALRGARPNWGRRLVLASATAAAAALAAFWLPASPTEPPSHAFVGRVELVGEPGAAGANATIAWKNDLDDAELIVRALSPAAPGSCYQLWRIRNGAPESVLVFEVSSDGDAAARFPLAREPRGDAYAVSVEPSGGSAQPTGPIVLASS